MGIEMAGDIRWSAEISNPAGGHVKSFLWITQSVYIQYTLKLRDCICLGHPNGGI